MAKNRAKDPIDRFRKRVVERGLVAESDLDAIDARAKEVVDNAVKFAEESPYPSLDEVVTDVYVSYP
jgi:pyruvate dehydrogenase E1 component alpha subunit